MAEQKPQIPDFMQKLYEGTDEEGQVYLEHIASRYEAARQDFMQTTYVQKTAFQTDWNRVSGERGQVDPDEAITPLKEQYAAEAKETAVRHGYQEKEVAASDAEDAPNDQPSTTDEARLEQSRRDAFQRNLGEMRAKRDAPQESTISEQQAVPDQRKVEGAQPDEEQSRRAAFIANMRSIQDGRDDSASPKLKA